MKKFRRKPIFIEAMQWWNHGDHPMVSKVPERIGDKLSQTKKYGYLNIDGGGHVISPGDWIVRHSSGEHSSCNPRTFERLYELDDSRVIESMRIVSANKAS